MEDIFKSIASPNWWVGVVLVGLALNLASAYLKAPLDRLMSRLSETWRRRVERSRLLADAQMAELRSSEDSRRDMWQNEIRARLQAIAFLLFAILFMLFYLSQRLRDPSTYLAELEGKAYWALGLSYWSSALCVVLSVARHFVAANRGSLLRHARDGQKAAQ
jgi:hypothetical protein